MESGAWRFYGGGGRRVAMTTLLDLFWPRFCLACGAGATAAGSGALGLCTPCSRRLAIVDPAASCRGCARPLAGEHGRCVACLADPPPYAELVALWRYAPPLREVIQAFKFQGHDYLGGYFARHLASRLSARPSAEVVVPMPVPWPRRLRRGFNPTEAIARPLARDLGLPCRRLLRRAAWSPHQTGRRRRERRLATGFAARRPEALRGRSILLIDDLFTTGATARAAAGELLRSGAARVAVAVVAWTPPRPSDR